MPGCVGDGTPHPGRIRSEAALAKIAGNAPISASSENATRHRLSRGGDRQLNRAIHTIVLTRMRTDAGTRAYLQRWLAAGKTKCSAGNLRYPRAPIGARSTTRQVPVRPAIDGRDEVASTATDRGCSRGLFAAIVVEFCQRACRAEHRMSAGLFAAVATERRQQFVPIGQSRMRRRVLMPEQRPHLRVSTGGWRSVPAFAALGAVGLVWVRRPNASRTDRRNGAA